MKRILLSTIMIAIGLMAFSQSPCRFLNLRPAYPLIIGETSVDGLAYDNNGLYMYDIPQDSLPHYEIGQIFAQTVSYTENGIGFYVKADSLHSVNVLYSCEVNEPPIGTIEFNEVTGRFKYYPAAEDYKQFIVTFTATNGAYRISEDVEFRLIPQTLPEKATFQTLGVMPDATDYTLVAETSKPMHLNNMDRTAYSVSISGKNIVFDNNLRNKVWGLSGREDIYELNIFAEKLIIRSAISFPQTNITVYAKELVFEDHDTIVASINTTPSAIATLVNESKGDDGANAGNISLYVKSFKGNLARRLILNGARGQSSNRNGTPGSGGNGGTVISSIDLSGYCDFARGSGGVKYDKAADDSNKTGQIIACGKMGNSGSYEFVDEPYSYLHPYYISAVIRHANDAFINNYTDYALQVCKEYRSLIEEYADATNWSQCNADDEVQLKNDLTKIDDMLLRMEQGLDYFGNPVGWVPLLSFEVMLANYDNEIGRAIPTLYMYYWLSRIDQTLEHKVEASQFAASVAKKEIENDQSYINTLTLEIPTLEDNIKEVESMIDDANKKKDALAAHLWSKAKRSVKKKNRIKKAVSLCSNIIKCVPVYGTALSSAFNVASNVAYATDLLGFDDHEMASAFTNAGSVDYSDLIKSVKEAYSSFSLDTLGKNSSYLKDTYQSLNKKLEPLVSSIADISKSLSTSSTPVSEVKKAFEQLKASSPEWQALEAEIKRLTQKKADLNTKLVQTLTNIMTTVSSLNENIIALDALQRDAFMGNSKRDLNAMQYLENMEQKAKNRLLKYHYYLRKAYEYRLLKPYDGEFNLVSMFERFETLGMALDSVVNEAAYSSLSSIFRDVVSDMAEKIIDEYSANYPEQSAPISVVIPKEQLDVINADGKLSLNFHEMGIFAPDEENVRIVNLGVQHIQSHIEGSVGYSGYMDLNLTHSGMSQFRKNGQLYWFDHMTRTSSSPHTWGVRYDAVSKESTNIQPSAASESLLSSIIGNGSNIMLFSRPAAWSDIALTKKVHTSGGADIVIDSLVLKLQYDFTRRPSNIRNIDITANDELLPYIACSEKDVNGRSNGTGNLYRSYNNSSQPVTFTAVDKYGAYYFVNWTDRAGKIVSDKINLTVSRTSDQFYRANYERRVPILNVPDTVKVGYEGGIYTVNVHNAGSGDIEMDWYVSDSLSSWVHLNDVIEGLDDGVFTFVCDANESGVNRLDSIEIIAPETDIMSKMIYIAQIHEANLGVKQIEVTNDSVRLFPNPAREYVTIEGDGISSVRIFSLAGREMMNSRINGDNCVSIDISNLQSGMYIFAIETKRGITSKKVLKTT